MDNMACNKVQPVVRKPKKKQVKDELDRIKQAEKKKRRLEKALATSAAIRSELEKKKQKKKEEQQRLDEEGPAIAEAVALHVLLGEDSDDSCKVMLRKAEVFNCWDYASDFGLFMGGGGPCHPHQVHSNFEGWVTDAYRAGHECVEFGNSVWSFSYGDHGRDLATPYFQDEVWEVQDFQLVLLQRRLFQHSILQRLQRWIQSSSTLVKQRPNICFRPTEVHTMGASIFPTEQGSFTSYRSLHGSII